MDDTRLIEIEMPPGVFPDCKVYGGEQRTDAWREIRRGKLTASLAGAWLGSEKLTKAQEQARLAAAYRMLSERARWYEFPVFETDAMTRGTILEPLAVEWFEKQTGLEVVDLCFCEHKSGYFGASPDGWIRDANAGFEGKAPTGAKHAQYVHEGVLPQQYEMQVHFSMAVTGADRWLFQSYHPGAVSLIVTVERNDLTERICAGMVDVIKVYEDVRQDLFEKHQAQFKK